VTGKGAFQGRSGCGTLSSSSKMILSVIDGIPGTEHCMDHCLSLYRTESPRRRRRDTAPKNRDQPDTGPQVLTWIGEEGLIRRRNQLPGMLQDPDLVGPTLSQWLQPLGDDQDGSSAQPRIRSAVENDSRSGQCHTIDGYTLAGTWTREGNRPPGLVDDKHGVSRPQTAVRGQTSASLRGAP
jgi:hypothetical protein